MTKTLFRRWSPALLVLAAFATLVLGAACGDDDDDDGTEPTQNGASPAATSPQEGSGDGEEIDYGSYSGSLEIDGSSTVYPISQAMAEEFASVAGDVTTIVGFSGTGGGAEKFCRGEIHLWDASRAARESDLESGCDGAGVGALDDLIEFQVGIDALTVVVNAQNDWAQCMTIDQLHLAFTDGGAARWSDIDPAWPDEEIIFYYPGTDSGTYDYFVEEVIEGPDEGAAHRSDGTPSEDDNVLALGVEQDRNAIGYFGFAYYQEAGDGLRAVSVDEGDGCVEPTFENALSGAYSPLSRPLFIYASEKTLTDAPQAAAFMHFVLSNSEEIVPAVGYINVPADTIAAGLEALDPYLD